MVRGLVAAADFDCSCGCCRWRDCRMVQELSATRSMENRTAAAQAARISQGSSYTISRPSIVSSMTAAAGAGPTWRRRAFGRLARRAVGRGAPFSEMKFC